MTTYHWTPALEREFVEALADTGSVTEACKDVSMSRRAAYDQKRRAAGLGFRIGWDAAVMLSRDVVADELMDRALGGQWTETVRDKESGVTRRFGQDRRLGLALLSRLDRMCDTMASEGTIHMAAQIVSQDFEAFLDLMTADAERSASVTDIRAFLDEREDAWRHCDQLPCDDVIETKAVPFAAPDATIVCEVAQSSGVSEDEADIELVRHCEEQSDAAIQTADDSGLPHSARNDETSAPATPGFIPFHSLPTNTPKPGQPEYGPWLKRQPWSRIW
jgi:hypothetical protein